MSSLTLPSIPAGHKMTAADWAQILGAFPLMRWKDSDQSVTSSTTQTNITDLTVPVAASTNYAIRAVIFYSGSTTGDINLGWTVPTGSSFKVTPDGFASGATGNTNSIYRGVLTTSAFGALAAQGAGVGSALTAHLEGILAVNTTAGNLQLQYAQGTSDATSTVIYSGSYLWVQKIS